MTLSNADMIRDAISNTACQLEDKYGDDALAVLVDIHRDLAQRFQAKIQSTSWLITAAERILLFLDPARVPRTIKLLEDAVKEAKQ